MSNVGKIKLKKNLRLNSVESNLDKNIDQMRSM